MKMDEYISKFDLLNACRPVIATGDDGVGTIGLTYEDIKKIPTADVRENVPGRWIFNENCYSERNIFFGVNTCSVCGWKAASNCIDASAFKFCPECGAKMRGTDQ